MLVPSHETSLHDVVAVPRIVGNQKLEEARKDPPLEPQQECGPADTFLLDAWHPGLRDSVPDV